MKRDLTTNQKRSIESIISHMRQYLELRFLMTREANPRFETIWPNLQWLLLQQLRNTLENDKMWGPKRYIVGELLVSNDYQKIRELFDPTNQVTIQTEVVEKKDEQQHKTADILEIRDFKTLYAAIDPSVKNIVALMQVSMWWDLADACDQARFDFKTNRLKELEKDFSDQWADFYHTVVGKGDDEPKPSKDEAIKFELEQLQYVIKTFSARREGEPGYKIIMAQRAEARNERAEGLITRIARELVLRQQIVEGKSLDDATKDQFAKALHVPKEDLTNEKELEYLDGLIAEQKGRLRSELMDEHAGEPYNFKSAQSREMRRRFAKVAAEHGYSEKQEEASA